MSIIARTTAEMLIKAHEGFRDRLYQCTAGKWTGGWGHNFTDNKLSVAVCQMLFNEDMADAEAEVIRVYGSAISGIDDIRKAVLLDLSFNLSQQAIEGFENFIKAVKDNDWEKAALELQFKDSENPEKGFTKWWNDVKTRGPKLQKILRTGVV